MSAPVVTQADIRAASPIAIKVMIGELEHDDLHQAFARHRTAAEAASAATVAELVEAATALASDVQELIDCRDSCGEWGGECPLQDAHKPDSTIDRLQRLLDVLAARAKATEQGVG